MRSASVVSRSDIASETFNASHTEAVAIKMLEERARYSLRLSDAALAQLLTVGDYPLEIPINACRVFRGMTIARLGPDEWLLQGDLNEVEQLAEEIENAVSEGFHALVDISHRNTAIVISGARAREILNGGCALDLSAKAFPPGTSTRTMFGKAEIVLLFTPDGLTYQIECWRSFLPYLRKYLEELALEFAVADGGGR